MLDDDTIKIYHSTIAVKIFIMTSCHVTVKIYCNSFIIKQKYQISYIWCYEYFLS